MRFGNPSSSSLVVRKLLETRTVTVASAGFRDISHFNRLFKRTNGASPREFRQAMTSSTGRTMAVAMQA